MIQKTKLNINKSLGVDKFYIPKDLFNYDLSVSEIRLLILLSSTQITNKGEDLTVDSLSSDLKTFIDHNNYNKIPSYAERLKEFGLINENGTGKRLEKDYVLFDKLPMFKNIRQLFMLCCQNNKWDRRGRILITINMFKNMFGEKTKRINEAWKRTNKQLKTDFSYDYIRGNVEIKDNNKISHKDKCVKKTTVEIPEGMSRREWYHEIYLKSVHWEEISNKYKSYYGKCQVCGSKSKLNLHHNNYDNLYKETDKDVVVLCEKCHHLFHKNNKI